MSFGKKQRLDEEEIDEEDYDQKESEEDSRLPPMPKPVEKQKKSNQLTKEEIGSLAQYHQIRATELLDLYRRLE